MRDQTVFKIKHLPTGLFYKPVGGAYATNKTNLSVRGKIYESKSPPKIPDNGYIYVTNSQVEKLGVTIKPKINEYKENKVETRKEDWKIIKYKLVEYD